jgi:hypothetical protein
VAALIATVVVVAVTALGNGAVGVDRLRAVGVPLLPFAGALAAEVVLGALLWLAIALVRERHDEHAEQDAHDAHDPPRADSQTSDDSGSTEDVGSAASNTAGETGRAGSSAGSPAGAQSGSVESSAQDDPAPAVS